MNETPGNFRCGASRCKTCPILKTTNIFVSKVTGERFTIKRHASCKTNDMWVNPDNYSTKMNSHRFDVTHGRNEDSPVAAHFRSDGHSESDLLLCVIDRLWTEDTIRRKNEESRWIRTLGTLLPRGMNLRSDAL